jgi:hypothetical protein
MKINLKKKDTKKGGKLVLKTSLQKNTSKNIDEEAIKIACEFAEKHNHAFEELAK